MRLLLTKESKSKLFFQLKKLKSANTLKELSIKLDTPKNTLENWFYNETRYVPEKIIPPDLRNSLEIIDQQEDNWGRIKGGRRTYQILLDKYGLEKIKERQKNGGRMHQLKRDMEKSFSIDINSPLFLEFYGVLLGDGWLSALKYAYTSLWWVGISGHSVLDEEYFIFLKEMIWNLFKKQVTTKYKKDSKAMEIIFCHKQFILFMNKNLEFPIGKKINLKIDNKFANNWNKIKFIIRGVFDTDGSLYFDKTPDKKPYPILSLHMNAPILLQQIYAALISQRFKIRFRENELILKGSKQLDKWMKLIGTNHPRIKSKYKVFLNYKKFHNNNCTCSATWTARQPPKL